MIPQQKIEANGTEIQSDTLSSTVWRIENAVSRASIVAGDTYSKHFIEDLDSLDTLAISYRYDTDSSWTKVFEGKIWGPQPELDRQKVTSALAYGYGRSLLKTHCAVNYGVESENSTTDTPSEIIADLITNRINKNFDAGNTGHAIQAGRIFTMNNPSIQFIKGGYRSNKEILDQVALLYQAYQAGSAGLHYFVDPDKYLMVDQIANHTVADWPTWWNHSQTSSLLIEGTDFQTYSFPVNAKEYYNKILLFTDVRKPGYDYWTEDSGGSNIWSYNGDTISDDNTAGYFIVGSHSLKLHSNAGGGGWAGLYTSYMTADAAAAQKNITVADGTLFKEGAKVTVYDDTPQYEHRTIDTIAGNVLTLTENLANAYTTANNGLVSVDQGWNFDAIGSEKNPPTLEFYSRYGANIDTSTTYIYLHTNLWTDFYLTQYCNGDTQDQWYHKTMPVGSYWKNSEQSNQTNWAATGSGGSEDWTDINQITILSTNAAPGGASNLWVDDMHFTGKIIREAYDSGEITTNNEYQKMIRLDVAVDDSMNTNDNTGTAAYLAYAELLHSLTIPKTGSLLLKRGYHEMKPGQLCDIKAHKTNASTYGIDDTFRITQIIHRFTPQGYTTQIDVTNDLVNTFSAGPGEQLSALAKVLFVDPEAKSLKSSGIDELVERLSVDYT